MSLLTRGPFTRQQARSPKRATKKQVTPTPVTPPQRPRRLEDAWAKGLGAQAGSYSPGATAKRLPSPAAPRRRGPHAPGRFRRPGNYLPTLAARFWYPSHPTWPLATPLPAAQAHGPTPGSRLGRRHRQGGQFRGAGRAEKGGRTARRERN